VQHACGRVAQAAASLDRKMGIARDLVQQAKMRNALTMHAQLEDLTCMYDDTYIYMRPVPPGDTVHTPPFPAPRIIGVCLNSLYLFLRKKGRFS
jgi:hypothetical protein